MKRERDEYGWIVEEFRGRKKPTKKYPDGLKRWVDVTAPGPFHTRRIDTAIKVAKRIKKKDQDRRNWLPPQLQVALGDPPVIRLRNTKSGDIIMADIL